MPGKCHASLLTIAFLLNLMVSQNVSAQVPRFSSAFLSDARITQPGKPVAVRIADPFARLDQERTLLRFLNEPHTYEWDDKTTVADVAGDVGQHIALRIDHRALEEIGLTADERLFPNSGAGSKKTRSARTPMDDPFAQRPSESSATLLTTKSPPKHWWERGTTGTPARRMTNAAALFHGLSNVDLVIATWSGRWVITTEEAAEENLSTRLYDVTPLVDIQDGSLSPATQGRINSYSDEFGRISSGFELIEVVETVVDPDIWEALGGPSTCRSVVMGDRTWLVMSTPVTTHWKVQTLLNQLNGS